MAYFPPSQERRDSSTNSWTSYAPHPDQPLDLSDEGIFSDEGGMMERSMSASIGGGAILASSSNSTTSMSPFRRCDVEQEKVGDGSRVAFRIKSEVEILDDGFKWRKYGKKSLKNSPNPRNYYRCSTDGCSVKKRVERDREDPGYVTATYDGIHNHSTPDLVYYPTQDHSTGRFLFAPGCQMPPSS